MKFMKTGSLISLLVVIGLFFLLDWSVLQNLLPLFQFPAIQPLGQFVKPTYWLLDLALPLALVATAATKGRGSQTMARLGSIFITLFITKIIFMLGILLGEGLHFIDSGLANWLSTESSSGLLTDGSAFKNQFAAGLAAVPFLFFVYGITRGKYRYTVHRKTLYFKDLPPAFDGFTITQVSDIHSGSFHNKKAVEKGIEMIKSQQSDLFVFTGDLVNNAATEIEPWIDLFKTIKAPFGQFSILGNHDYGDYMAWPSPAAKSANMQRLQRNHAAMGFRLLLDEHVLLEKGGQQVALLGIENWGVGFGKRGDLAKALQGIPPNTFKILLSHDPSHWEQEVKNHPENIGLTFSGHTHGMQMGIEAFGWKWSPSKFRYPRWAGLYNENGRFLYVNRGFGFLGFAGRVGIWPEITVVTLIRKE